MNRPAFTKSAEGGNSKIATGPLARLFGWAAFTLAAAGFSFPCFGQRESLAVGKYAGGPHAIPGFWAVHDVRGGTDATNNAKSNPSGGYLSHLDHIKQYQYPGGHGNTWDNTALVNDWNVWDKPGFHWDQKYPTASPLWDALQDHSTAWLETGEWVDYEVNVAKAGVYKVTLRMASGQGPDPLPQGQTRHQVRIDIDGKNASGVMPVLWTGEGAYPVDPSPKFNKGPYGWSWIHHFFDVRSPGIKLSAGAHSLRVFMVDCPRGDSWLEHVTVARPGDPLPVAAPRVKSTLLMEAPPGEVACELSDLKAGTHWQGGATPDDISSLMDGNPWTQIALADTNNFQQTGDFVSARVMKSESGFSHIRLIAPPETKDLPQHWEVQTSPDGVVWSKSIASGIGTPNATDIRFPVQSGRNAQYVRVTLTKSALGWWRIGEFQVFGPVKAAGAATPQVKPDEPPQPVQPAPAQSGNVPASQWQAVPMVTSREAIALSLPAKWIEPIGDDFRCGVKGHEQWKISELARRICAAGRKVQAFHGDGIRFSDIVRQTGPDHSASAAFPLKADRSGRYLVDRQGRPFLINADTIWAGPFRFKLEEWNEYLDHRKAQGFNSLQVQLLPFADLQGTNAYGVRPFADANDLTKTIDDYWTHIDRVVDAAGQHGMLVLANPSWLVDYHPFGSSPSAMV